MPELNLTENEQETLERAYRNRMFIIRYMIRQPLLLPHHSNFLKRNLEKSTEIIAGLLHS